MSLDTSQDTAADESAPAHGRLRRVLARGASGAFLIGVLALIAQFGSHVLLARLLGEEEYGIFMYAVSWLGLLLMFGKLGMDTTSVAYVSAYEARGEWGVLRGLMRRSLAVVLVASGVVGVLTAIAAAVFVAPERLQLATTFYLVAVVLPLYGVLGLHQSTLRGLGRVVVSQSLEPLLRLVLLVLFVAALSLVGAGLDGPMAMAANGVAIVLCLVVARSLTLRTLPRPSREAAPEYRSRTWWGMALPSMFSTGMGLLLKQSDIILIGLLLGDVTAAGIYAVGTRIALLTTFGLSAVNAALAPMVSSLHHTGSVDELQRLVRLAAWAISAITVALGIGVVVLGELLLGVFGSAFVVAYDAMVVLVAAQCFNGLCGPVGQVMTMMTRQRQKAAILALGAGLNVALNVILIPAHGILGAAVGTAIATLFWNLAMSVYVVRVLGVNPTVFAIFSRTSRT